VNPKGLLGLAHQGWKILLLVHGEATLDEDCFGRAFNQLLGAADNERRVIGHHGPLDAGELFSDGCRITKVGDQVLVELGPGRGLFQL
jgi:hypothetical protein